MNYTNASFVVGKDFDFKDGMFAGYDEATRKYDKSKWAFDKDADGNIKRDNTLASPRCVFQLMKKHYSRCTIDRVVEMCGTSKKRCLRSSTLTRPPASRTNPAQLARAIGWTQHTVGVQNIPAP